MSARSSAASLLLTQVSGARAVPHGVTHMAGTMALGAGGVSLWITWGLPWVPEC